MRKVHLAVQVFQGVLNDVEVHETARPAQTKVKAWQDEGEGKVDATYLEREVIEYNPEISVLNLPHPYEYRLRRCGITTLLDLTSMSERELYSLRTVGMKCIQAVKEALAHEGLSLATRIGPKGKPSELPEAVCLCKEDQPMEVVADNPRGTYFECLACGRLLYRSKMTPVVAWYRADILVGVPDLQIERRFCADCNSLELHVKASGGLWRCIACVLKSLEPDSQKSPEGA